jgi:PAS domain S-box-containing protein
VALHDETPADPVDLELAFRTAPIALCVFDRSLRLARVNDSFAALCGAAADAMPGRPLREAAPPIADLLEEPVRHVLCTEQPLTNVELRLSGGAVPEEGQDLLVSLHPLTGCDSAATAVVASIQDITAQKSVERRLRQSDERYAAAIAAGESGVWDADLENGINYIDPVVRKLIGIPLDKPVGPIALWIDRLGPGDRENIARAVQEHIRDRTPQFEYETKLCREGLDEDRYISIRGRALMLPDGRVGRAVGTITNITRRKKAELELAEHRAKLESLLASRTAALKAWTGRLQRLSDSSIIGVLIAERGGLIRDANDAFLRLIGGTRADLPLGWCQVAPIEYEAFDRRARAEIDARGYASPYEREMLHRDGHSVPVLLGIAETVEQSGECVAFVVDRTEEKRARASLAESDERTRALLAAIPDIIVRVREDGTIVEFRSGLPLPPDARTHAITGQRIQDVDVPLELRQLAMNGVARVLCSGGVVHLDLPIVRRDGLHHFEARLVRGAPSEVIAIVRDVTERRAAENALRRSEERFRRLVERSWEAISLVDAAGFCQYVSPGVVRILGRRESDYIGRLQYEFCHPDDVPLATRRMQEVLARPGGVASAEVRGLREDGTWRWLEIIATNLIDEPSVGGVVINGRDVTERRLALDVLRREKISLVERVAEHSASLANATRQLEEEIQGRREAEAQLRRAERLASIGTLAAGIAHEINNPLAAISASAELALAQLDGGANPALRQALAQVVEQAQRGGNIVRSVLRFAREGRAERRPYDLSEIARRAVDVLRAEVERRSLDVDFAVSGEAAIVLANAIEMEQVITNLLRNAVQAGASRIALRTSVAGHAVRLEVVDDGCGMDAREMGRIFDPFYTTRQTQGGTGLGLSVAHGIVGQHGGAIDVRSEPARGTTITVDLPLARGSIALASRV